LSTHQYIRFLENTALARLPFFSFHQSLHRPTETAQDEDFRSRYLSSLSAFPSSGQSVRDVHWYADGNILLLSSTLVKSSVSLLGTTASDGDDNSVQRADPILAPGKISQHVHQIFGNTERKRELWRHLLTLHILFL
jgi:hypothetical protein